MEIVKILLSEGGDVVLVARTSKLILVFPFAISQLNYTCLYIALLLLPIHTCFILCLHLFYPRELLKNHNSYKRGILMRSSRATVEAQKEESSRTRLHSFVFIYVLVLLAIVFIIPQLIST